MNAIVGVSGLASWALSRQSRAMRILAIETIETTGSIAVLDDDRVVAERRLDDQHRSAQSLVPGIAAMLERAGWSPADVELVAVATGPGSFTGLRIGVTTAKTFAYAVRCQVIGVHTLLAVAAQAPADAPRFSTVLDAQRNELFVADFSRASSGELTGHESTRIVRCQEWLAGLTPGNVLTGPGLSKIGDRLPAGVRVLDANLWSPTAATIGRIGWRQFQAGHRDNAFDLVPEYFRRTAAEEQWDRKHSG
jgi:tRNA threonylcarbamoyladenosine biosynthesis protein TsaB